jgi:hypothetical protein
MPDPRTALIEEDDIVELGSTPGETHGYECAGCQAVSGLAYGSHQAAAEGLARHQANDHTMSS